MARKSADGTAISTYPTLAVECAGELERCAAPARGGDAGAVHAMRIALRKLRVALSVFGATVGPRRGQALERESRWLSDVLGQARDIDVALESFGRERRGAARGTVRAGGLPTLRRMRRDRYARVGRALRSARFARLLGALRDSARHVARRLPSATKPRERRRAAQFVADELGRRRRKFVKAAARLAKLGAKDRHHLRIRGRKLRYAMEFLAAAFPGKRRRKRRQRAVESLQRLQNALGALQDLSRRLELTQVRRRGPGRAKDVAPQRISSAQHARARRHLGAALLAIDEFAAIRPFWD